MSVTTDTRERRDRRRSDLARQLESFDPVEWQPRVVARRTWCKITATRRRKWVTWSVIVTLALLVISVAFAAVAAAAGDGGEASGSGNSALGFTQVRDSHGVYLANYIYATNHGGLTHLDDTGTSTVIGFVFAIFMVVVTIPIWLVGWVLGFGWMAVFSGPLNGIAHALSGQLATTIMLLTFATIGAFFVAYFVVRGFFSKAAVQGVTMLVVAVIGPMYLADPLGEVLSPHGLLAEGRDVGLSVSAGLNGNSNPNPSQMVASLQEDMADNFARKPVQVWNFGHVVDDRSGCGEAWSAGVRAGSEGRIKDGMKQCGDYAAYSSANNPSFGQIGAGLVLLFTALVLLIFAVYLSIKIIWSALDSVYWGLMTIFGFAGLGLVYGPTQTFTVRAVVHGMMSAVRMCFQIIALGIYLLFFGDLFRQAKGQEMSIFVIGAIVMIVAALQFDRLSSSLESGNEWVANRLALTIQGPPGGGGGGGGGGRALGMGEAAAGHKAGSHMMMALAGASTIAGSPISEWLLGGLPGTIHPQSRIKKIIAQNSAVISSMQLPFWADPEMGGEFGAYKASYRKWSLLRNSAINWAAETGGSNNGGVGTARGAAKALLSLDKRMGVTGPDAGAVLLSGGWDGREEVVRHAVEVSGLMASMAKTNPLADGHLAGIMAGQNLAENALQRLQHMRGRTPTRHDEQHLEAAVYAMREHAWHYRDTLLPGGVTLAYDGINEFNGMPFHGIDLAAIRDDYVARPSEAKMKAIQEATGGNVTSLSTAFNGLHNSAGNAVDFESLARDPAARLMKHISNGEAMNLIDAADDLADGYGTLTHQQLTDRVTEVRRLANLRANTENWSSGSKRALTHPAPPRP
ncbi:putative membrane protein [Nocardia nova SH22a]|uniref:Putative membrane protein n=1 Tax=Nocardia nova SH22a TaxID=1415166 RepID=W5TAP6_9NOCA|nr:hypothetical protein [Nocardia nova]AHH16395.1 putative membrane protein [Nocardia nova SH22a]